MIIAWINFFVAHKSLSVKYAKSIYAPWLRHWWPFWTGPVDYIQTWQQHQGQPWWTGRVPALQVIHSENSHIDYIYISFIIMSWLVSTGVKFSCSSVSTVCKMRPRAINVIWTCPWFDAGRGWHDTLVTKAKGGGLFSILVGKVIERN